MQRPGDLRRDVVGIDVVALAVRADADRRDDGHVVLVEEVLDEGHVDLLDGADVADVDLLLFIALVDRRELLLSADEVRILAREANGAHAAVVEQVDDLGVDLAVEDHLRDLDRLRIRHAQAGDER